MEVFFKLRAKLADSDLYKISSIKKKLNSKCKLNKIMIKNK